jgi:hypothetical protein
MIMKSIAKAVLIATLSMAATAALAGGSTFPRSVDDNNPSLMSESRAVNTYADRHMNDGVAQVGPTFPASATEHPFLASEFPGIVTYADQHVNDGVARVGSTFPASAAGNAVWLTSEFPGIVTYADQHGNQVVSIRTAQAPGN